MTISGVALMHFRDSYTIEITLRHPAYSPERISRVIALKPNWTRVIGESSINVGRQWNVFNAVLQKGNSSSEYQSAVVKVGLFLDINENNWAEFIAGGAEVELTLSHTVCQTDEIGDKCLDLFLTPLFLSKLASRGIGLRIQGWQGELVS
jgi:hypothetical protein